MRMRTFGGALAVGLLLSGCVVPQGAVVVQEPVGYNSWPMIQAVGDRLVCAYSRGKGHDIQEGGRGVFAKVSDDGGRTWSAETPVVNDPRVGGTWSIVRCEVTRDLRYAKVRISILEEERRKSMMAALNRAAGFIRRELGHRMIVRCAPELIFELDTNIEYAAHINELLKQAEAQHNGGEN